MDIDERIAVAQKHGYATESAQDWYVRYKRHLFTADKRGVGSELSFDQYMSKAREAGLSDFSEIGRCKGQYQLGRVGDVGVYVDGNCRFITTEQNRRECFENGRATEGNQRRAALMTGLTKDTSERLRKSSESLRGRTKETDAGHAIRAAKIAKQFVLRSPDGVTYTGSNLSEFCDTNDLSKFAMYDVFAGRRPHHKGWTGRYI